MSLIRHVECASTEEFLDKLSPGHRGVFGGREYFEWAFRGHAIDDQYKLLPRALRSPDELSHYQSRVVSLIRRGGESVLVLIAESGQSGEVRLVRERLAQPDLVVMKLRFSNHQFLALDSAGSRPIERGA